MFETVKLTLDARGQSEATDSSIPPFLQIPFVHCKYLMRTHKCSEEFGEIIGVLLGAALHHIISLAQSLDKLFDDDYDDFESALAEDESLVQLLPVAPRLAGRLNGCAHSFFLIGIAKSH
jgi:hypothetical protein